MHTITPADWGTFKHLRTSYLALSAVLALATVTSSDGKLMHGCLSATVQELSDSRQRALLRSLPVRRTQCVACWTGQASGTIALGVSLALALQNCTAATAAFALADPKTSGMSGAGQHSAIGTRVGSSPAFSPTGQTAWRPRLGRVHCKSAQPRIDHTSPRPPKDPLPLYQRGLTPLHFSK